MSHSINVIITDVFPGALIFKKEICIGNLGQKYIVIIIVIILVLVGTLALYLLMKRRTGKKNIVTFTKETGKSVENYIFLCPKCNEKADEDLGYCIDCGATFDEQ